MGREPAAPTLWRGDENKSLQDVASVCAGEGQPGSQEDEPDVMLQTASLEETVFK